MAPASVSRLILTDGIDKYTTSAQRIALQRHTLKERTPHSRRENRPVVHFFFIDRGVVLIVLYHMRPVSRFTILKKYILGLDGIIQIRVSRSGSDIITFPVRTATYPCFTNFPIVKTNVTALPCYIFSTKFFI